MPIDQQIIDRLSFRGLSCTSEQIAKHSAYIELMAKWNRTINLTSLQLQPLGDAAIDKLIVEPVEAAKFIDNSAKEIVDIGSGGGSPGFPIQIQRQDCVMNLIESRSRKCAFLREVARALELKTRVEETRFEEIPDGGRLRGQADVITIRAVASGDLVRSMITKMLKPGGQIIWFGEPDTLLLESGFSVESRSQEAIILRSSI